MSARPLVAVSIGDPCGIGPEIALRIAAEAERLPARVLLLGDARALDRDRALVPEAPPIPVLSAKAMARSAADVALDEASDLEGRRAMPTLPPRGKPNAGAGPPSNRTTSVSPRFDARMWAFSS